MRYLALSIFLLFVLSAICQERTLIVDVPQGETGALYSPFGFIDEVPFHGKVDPDKAGRFFVVTKTRQFQDVDGSRMAVEGASLTPVPFTYKLPKDSMETFRLLDVQRPTSSNVAMDMVINMQAQGSFDLPAMTKAGKDFLAAEGFPIAGPTSHFDLTPVYNRSLNLYEPRATRFDNYSILHAIEWRLVDTRTNVEVYRKEVYGGYFLGDVKLLGGTDRIREIREEESYASRKAFVSSLQCLLNDPDFITAIKKGRINASPVETSSLTVTDPNASYASSVQQCLPSVVTVHSSVGFGSGFFITSDGYFLTNDHVLAPADTLVTVVLSNGFSLKARVVRRDAKRDVALLKMDGATVLPLRCDPVPRQTGAEVYAIGTPEQTSLSQTLTKGIISGNRELEGRTLIQTDVGINHGNSGGPLVDADGKVIGIVSAKLVGEGTEAIGFAIPIGDAFSALKIR